MTELKVLDNTVERIVASKHLYLASNEASENELARNIEEDAKYLGVNVKIEKINDWWAIYGSDDWLSIGTSKSVKDLFTNLEGLQNAPQNSFRREVLLTAFAEQVITWKDESVDIIKGQSAFPHDLLSLKQRLSEGARVIAFKGIA